MTKDAMIRLWLRYFKKVFISQRHIETLNRLKDVLFVKYFKIIQLGRRKQKTLADKMSLKKKSLLKPVDGHFKTCQTFLSSCIIIELFHTLKLVFSVSICLLCLAYSPIKLSFIEGKMSSTIFLRLLSVFCPLAPHPPTFSSFLPCSGSGDQP